MIGPLFDDPEGDDASIGTKVGTPLVPLPPSCAAVCVLCDCECVVCCVLLRVPPESTATSTSAAALMIPSSRGEVHDPACGAWVRGGGEERHQLIHLMSFLFYFRFRDIIPGMDAWTDCRAASGTDAGAGWGNHRNNEGRRRGVTVLSGSGGCLRIWSYGLTLSYLHPGGTCRRAAGSRRR
eukprot:g9526.t1